MKKSILSIILTSSIITIFSQDLIIKKTGDEIKAKITEIGHDDIKYKKFDNKEGPVYTISKSIIFMIKYENGTNDVFTNEKKNDKNQETLQNKTLRKGLHVGFHITPGAGKLQYNKNGFVGINLGADLNFYLTENLGFKTGVSYFNLPYNYKLNNYGGVTTIKGKKMALGIPIKLLVTTGNKTGFYFESGYNFYFPINSVTTSTRNNNVTILADNSPVGNTNIIIAQESVVGINVKTSEQINLNFGVSSYYALTNNSDTRVFIGLQVGMLFKI